VTGSGRRDIEQGTKIGGSWQHHASGLLTLSASGSALTGGKRGWPGRARTRSAPARGRETRHGPPAATAGAALGSGPGGDAVGDPGAVPAPSFVSRGAGPA